VIRRAFVGTLAIGLSLGGLQLARMYQAQRLRLTINGYLRAPVHPLILARTDTVQLHSAAAEEFAGQSADLHWARLLRVELNASACRGATVTYQYDRASPFRGLTTTVALLAANRDRSDHLVMFEPVYTGFASVDIYQAGGDCLRSVGQVTGLQDEAVWLPLMLGTNWRNEALYQTIRTRENIH
jgi:hypothetical protein